MRSVTIALLVVTAAVAAACGGGGDGYSDEVESVFIQSCTAAPGLPEETCRCVYTQITRAVSYDDFVELHRAMEADPEYVPPTIERAFVRCAARESGPTTTSS